MTVTKKVIDLYKIPGVDAFGGGWAHIAIDEEHHPKASHGPQNSFRIYISSDYGDWTFYWSHPGACWRSFLLKINMDYAATKFGASDWFDSHATERWLKQDIMEARRSDSITKEGAREAWEAVCSAVNDCGENPDLLCERLIGSEWADAWNGDWVDRLNMKRTTSPQFRAFWNGPWQEFLQVIGKERERMAA